MCVYFLPFSIAPSHPMLLGGRNKSTNSEGTRSLVEIRGSSSVRQKWESWQLIQGPPGDCTLNDLRLLTIKQMSCWNKLSQLPLIILFWHFFFFDLSAHPLLKASSFPHLGYYETLDDAQSKWTLFKTSTYEHLLLSSPPVYTCELNTDI